MTTETRLAQVESELADVTARLRRLEGGTEAEYFEPRQAPAQRGESQTTVDSPPAISPAAIDEAYWSEAEEPVPPSATSAPTPDSPIWGAPRERTAPSALSALDLEALFGGRVLAWIGGLAILFGAVLFLGMAMSRGWLDEEARTIIAAVIGLAALFGGVWLHEREGRTDAAKALVASAVSGLFGTIVVATQLYSLISPELGLVLGAAVAAAGFGIAVRWRSPLVATIGALGALGTPIMTGVGPTGTGIAFVALALAATAAILVWQRWDWLALGAFIVSAPQLLFWAASDGREHLVLGIAVLAGFWLLYAGSAVAYELRTREKEMLPVASWLLLLGSCVTFVGPGYAILDGADHHTAAVVLLFGFAALQAGLGVIAFRLRIHRELGSLLIAIGIALAAFGLGETFDGPALVVAWAAAAVTLAALGARLDDSPDPAGSDAERMLLAAGGFLALAIVHTLVHEAPPAAIVHGLPDLGVAASALAACVAATFGGAWFARRVSPAGARVVFFGGVALAALGLGECFHGVALVVAWAAGAVILAALGSRFAKAADAERMLLAAGGYLALAAGHTLIVEAPPSAIFEGVRDLGDATLALAACAAATFAGGLLTRQARPEATRVASFVGATLLVYLGSVLIVDMIGVTAAGVTRQAGQTWLSAFWTVTGLGAVVVGLLRRTADVRLAGLALLAVAIGKVWTYDLSELDEVSRVLSFVGLGLLLLVGAFAYQRIKPEVERNGEPAR